MIKSVRNNLLDKDFILTGNTVASWSHYKQFYELDSKTVTQLRAAPKLNEPTDVNLNSFKRMKVKYSTQVFSNTVSAVHSANDSKISEPHGALTTAEFFKEWTTSLIALIHRRDTVQSLTTVQLPTIQFSEHF